jgi:hypothetical protein
MPHLYRNHKTAILYDTDHALTEEELKCDDCVSTDSYLGYYETAEEKELLEKAYRGWLDSDDE